jgi:hypothetical protein
MSALPTKIVNVTKITKRDSSEKVLIHYSYAQWKKALAKAKKIKSPRKLRIGTVYLRFLDLPVTGGGVLSAFVQTKSKGRELFPHIVEYLGQPTVMFADSWPGTGSTRKFGCKIRVKRNGQPWCESGDYCKEGCSLTQANYGGNVVIAFCTCDRLARY